MRNSLRRLFEGHEGSFLPAWTALPAAGANLTRLGVLNPVGPASAPWQPTRDKSCNGKFTGADRCRFFDHARGSALESAAALDVSVAKTRCSTEGVSAGQDRLWTGFF